jgi:hypothetical protein
VSNDGANTPELFLKGNPRYALVCPLYTTPPAAQPEQGPVAQQYAKLAQHCTMLEHKLAQRPWVGLTDDEVAIASAEFDTRLKLAFHSGMYKAQIILRKKNDPTY